MERLPLEEYDPQGLQALTELGRPIPGQLLTNNINIIKTQSVQKSSKGLPVTCLIAFINNYNSCIYYI